MATDLYIISNIKTNKEVILEKKNWYIKELNALRLDCIIAERIKKPKSQMNYNFWEYELPTIYDANKDIEIPDTDAAEIIYFSSPTIFSIRVYENCLLLNTIYKYSFLYCENKTEEYYFWEFRKNIFDIISIFGGTEIIYLADNACDKLSKYLEGEVLEGISYDAIKQDIIRENIPLVSDYYQLKYDELDYKNIKEIIFDNFNDLN